MAGGAHRHTSADIDDPANHVHIPADIRDLDAFVRAIVRDELASVPGPTPEPEPEQWRWPLPELVNPRQLFPPPSGRFTVTLDPGEDAVLHCPAGGRKGPTVVTGGRHVIIGPGRWNVAADTPIPTTKDPADHVRFRVFTITGQTGEVHLRRVLCDNPDNRHHDVLTGGGRDATWVIQQCRFVNQRGIVNGWHGDVCQPWDGLDALLMDRVTIQTNYQGLYLHASRNSPPVGDYVLSNVDLRHEPAPVQSSLFWLAGRPGVMTNVYAESTNRIDGDNGPVKWIVGRPPFGDFVPEGSVGA